MKMARLLVLFTFLISLKTIIGMAYMCLRWHGTFRWNPDDGQAVARNSCKFVITVYIYYISASEAAKVQ